ncbi:MAG: transcription elongation factor GreA [Anaerolineales bacterium]|jgi:transcription elongation factor GreA|nr:transcription elongation factor GreA [Anaerolineales bacterium]
MPETPYLTEEGAEKLRAELVQLTGPARETISKRLREAIQMGDLSENADYHKAKEDQGFLEGRIQELQYILKNAIIVSAYDGPREIVEVGARVTVQEEDFEPETYLLVGAKEASPREGKISNESPIGRALLGKRVGERANAQTPGGEISLKILKIE